jgi:hypothetical protein
MLVVLVSRLLRTSVIRYVSFVAAVACVALKNPCKTLAELTQLR